MKKSTSKRKPYFLNGRPRPAVSIAKPQLEPKYDPDSGQVYQEREIRFVSKRNTDWTRERVGRDVIHRDRPPEKGTRSLAETAIFELARHSEDLTPEHFASVPWPMARRIWDRLVSRGRHSFHIWRIFAVSYPGAEEFGHPDYRHRVDILHPTLPYTDYFTGITSNDLNWLACLRVSPKQMSATDMVSIHKVTNLVVLDLSDGQISLDNRTSPFDERIMRSWAELAEAGQAFQLLRVILFGWQEHICKWLFKYVDVFPSLCHVIVTDCPRMHQRNRREWEPFSTAAGWDARHAKRSAKDLRPIVERGEAGKGYVCGFYDESQSVYEDLVHPRRPDLVERLPLLDTEIGTPRQWRHIVDDFPSTRTILFDNIKTKAWEEEGKNPHVVDIPQSKRLRNSEGVNQGTASPPAKRSSQTAPRTRPSVRTAGDLLQEFLPR
ncbi:uncharacterized protein PV06_04923 [Exophiala oligosperma]|uniref:Uncharacterized protein n=2 Tax=Chaetothyriales TaxID=34395 RepID=A0A0D2E7T3_9EURO|nr:uncharacterized protein PV06_04923 [Exophiala oligosperma]KAJ9638094.1 hypothetical protein H2204_004405 [Knufia peltigerae]KIW43864.1 hypothetical protein PV06_04923 [Exophiala oligosperma]